MMAGQLHDYSIRGLTGGDLERIRTALSSLAQMHQILAEAETDPAEAEWNRMEAAHLLRIRGAVTGARVLA